MTIIAYSETCPECKAAAGVTCYTKTGKPMRKPHVIRDIHSRLDPESRIQGLKAEIFQ